MTQDDDNAKPSDGESGEGTTPTEKPIKPSPKFPPGVTIIGHGGGPVRTSVETPKLPREPSHGSSSIRPEKLPDGF